MSRKDSLSQRNQSSEYKRFINKFPSSIRLYNEAIKHLPAGVGSTSRARWSGWEPYPIYVHHGHGAHIVDVDGNDFIDYLLGLGPMLLGHCPQIVTESVVNQIQNCGTVFALGSEIEIDAAKKICDTIPSVDKVRFLNSGTEAVMYSVRLARAFSGRNKIIRFEGMYHGFSDSVYWSKHPSKNSIDAMGNCIPEPQGPGLPKGVDDSLLICQWNDPDALAKMVENNYNDIAAIITEPVMCNTGCILPEPGYLETLRELCDKYHIVLIFDEVITGFRMGITGAQGYYHISPDISVFAKGLGGGYPVAALGGKQSIMELVDSGKVSISGTYSGNGIALSAVSATIDYLSNPKVYEKLNHNTAKLKEGLSYLWNKTRIKTQIVGAGAFFQIWFSDHPIHNYREAVKYSNEHIFRMWWEEMLFQGVLFHPHHFETLFVSTAHTSDDIEKTLDKAERAIAAVEKRMEQSL